MRMSATVWAAAAAAVVILAAAKPTIAAAVTEQGTATTLGGGAGGSTSKANQITDSFREWLSSSPDGYMSPKVRVEQVHPTEPWYGLFATDDLSPNELIFKIPRSHLITAGINSEEECDTARNLAREMRLDEESVYAPYVRYLKENSPPGQLPSAWSENGLTLLSAVLGYPDKQRGPGGKSENDNDPPAKRQQQQVRPLPPYELDPFNWANDCLGNNENELEVNAYMMMKQRGWDDILIPVLDMVNHRNGQHLNTRVAYSVHHPTEPVTVLSSQPIAAGEELYYSYNLCEDCGNRMDDYGTPEILRDYGFVEQYPQRWVFHGLDLGFDISQDYTTVDDDDSSTSTQKLDVVWQDHEPHPKARHYLEYHLERLETIGETLLSNGNYTNLVPPLELMVIRQYYETTRMAITLAVEDYHNEETPLCVLHSHEGVVNCYNKSDREAAAAAAAAAAGGAGAGNNAPPRPPQAVVPPQEQQQQQEPHRRRPRGLITPGGYDPFHFKHDDLDYQAYTCTQGQTMIFPDYDDIERLRSEYQLIKWYMHPETKDTCFNLEDTVQICGSYRPHYHEMEVHYTAQFIPEVKRVVFVGGGDSMLLHEILKYPSLEKVVGLELDQLVTRSSYKHFGTQPHWDDERVEWWFGDASKSLLMLPEDYFGSFDMVLVDLSETVMSMSVTEGLDIFGALALLLQPQGIIVKNELYLEKFSDLFDYTLQIHFYDVPVVCSQSLILGSYHNDFLQTVDVDHGIDGIVYRPFLERMKETGDRYEIWHDYRRNGTLIEQHRLACEEKEDGDDEVTTTTKEVVEVEPQEQKRSPGIMMILEAEDANAETLATAESVEGTIIRAVSDTGFDVVSTTKHSSPAKEVIDNKYSSVLVVLKEGYIVARSYPSKSYCAFDVHLWSHFEKHEELKTSLLEAVGSTVMGKSSSSYRIVAGGMYGIESWKDDETNRGPQKFTPDYDCDSIKDNKKAKTTTDAADKTTSGGAARGVFTQDHQGIMDSILEKNLNIIQQPQQGNDDGDSSTAIKGRGDDDDLAALVICGHESTTDDSSYCSSSEVMSKMSSSLNIQNVITVHTCPTVSGDEYVAGLGSHTQDFVRKMLKCEEETYHTLLRKLGVSSSSDDNKKSQKIRVIILDPSAPRAMAQIVYKMLSHRANQKIFLSDELAVLAPIIDSTGVDSWRMNFLDRFRTEVIIQEPNFLSGILYNTTDVSMEMGLLSSGDIEFVKHLMSIRTIIEKDLGLSSDVRNIQNGEFLFQPDPFHPSIFALPNAYDQTGPYEQWKSQHPLGHQTVYQLEMTQPIIKGDRVRANYRGDGQFYPGKVAVVDDSDNGKFGILYDDGEYESDVLPHLVVRDGPPPSTKTEVELSLSAEEIEMALKHALTATVFTIGGTTTTDEVEEDRTNNIQSFDVNGDGTVLASLWSGGMVVALWDGRLHVDVNLFTHEERSFRVTDGFMDAFKLKIPNLITVLRDEQPRGYGRVVSFQHDIARQSEVSWAVHLL